MKKGDEENLGEREEKIKEEERESGNRIWRR